MDSLTTKSIAWGVAAVVSYTVVMLMNPWAGSFRRGWRFCGHWQRFWMFFGLVAAQQIWWQERTTDHPFAWPQNFAPPYAAELLPSAAIDAAISLFSAVWLPLSPTPLSGLVAILFFLNWGGLTSGLRIGCEAVFGKFGNLATALCLLSAASNVAWLGLETSGRLPAQSATMQALHVCGALWSGATVALALGWLLRFAETSLRNPEEILQIPWASSAAGRIPRLWPCVLIGMGCELMPAGLIPRWLIALLAIIVVFTTAYLPKLLVHWRGIYGLPILRSSLLSRLKAGWHCLLFWTLVGYTHLFLVHLTAKCCLSGLPGGNGWTLAAASLFAILLAAIQVWLLVSWISMQPLVDFAAAPGISSVRPKGPAKSQEPIVKRLSGRTRITRTKSLSE